VIVLLRVMGRTRRRTLSKKRRQSNSSPTEAVALANSAPGTDGGVEYLGKCLWSQALDGDFCCHQEQSS
jgi:hypothetical protein